MYFLPRHFFLLQMSAVPHLFRAGLFAVFHAIHQALFSSSNVCRYALFRALHLQFFMHFIRHFFLQMSVNPFFRPLSLQFFMHFTRHFFANVCCSSLFRALSLLALVYNGHMTWQPGWLHSTALFKGANFCILWYSAQANSATTVSNQHKINHILEHHLCPKTSWFIWR